MKERAKKYKVDENTGNKCGDHKKRIVIGASGASGFPVLKKCLELIRKDENYRSVLIMSRNACRTMETETDDVLQDYVEMKGGGMV